MMIFLVTISIAFNMIAFLFIAILFLRQNKLIKMEEKLRNPTNEIEDLMSTYLLQLKEENEHFINRVSHFKKENSSLQTTINNSATKLQQEEEKRFQPIERKKDPIDKKSDQLNDPESFTSLLGKTISNQAVKAYQRQNQSTEKEQNQANERVNIDKDTMEQNDSDKKISRTNANNQIVVDLIIHLQKQGYSLETIAKKLNMGKTEIDLFLKFHENTKE